jgi:outer membrane protein TolC
MKQITLAMFAMFVVQQVNAQNKNEFTLIQAVDYGMKNSAQVKNALLDIKIQHETNREFTANAYPQLNGNAGVTHFFNIPVTSLPDFISPATYQVLVDKGVQDGSGNPIGFPQGGFGNIAAQFGVPWTASGGLDLSQILFDGQVFVGLQARDAAMKLATANAAITTDMIKANIQKVYYQLVVAQKQLATLQANIELLEKLSHDTKELFNNGFAEKLDVEKVTVQLTNLKTEQEKVNNSIKTGYAGLKFLIAMPQKEELVLTDTLSEDFIKSNILDESYDYNSRKEVQALTFANKLNEYNLKRFRLSRIPSLVAFASYSKNAQRSQFNFFNKGDWFTTSLAGVKMSIPIFDGFARRARIETAKLNLGKTRNTLAQTKELVDYDVNTARYKMKSAILTMDSQKQNIQLAEKVYNSTKKKYEQGLGSNLEIFTAQTELRTAQNNYYSSLYDAITAKIDYQKATGKL